tara:strand:- start:374 stop:568 length:195 start_codon:yes stop_codon:yes gene_type:complete
MRTTLAKFAENKSLAEIARILGVSRAAVSQMIENNREIYIESEAGGKVTAWEKRPVPTRRSHIA